MDKEQVIDLDEIFGQATLQSLHEICDNQLASGAHNPECECSFVPLIIQLYEKEHENFSNPKFIVKKPDKKKTRHQNDQMNNDHTNETEMKSGSLAASDEGNNPLFTNHQITESTNIWYPEGGGGLTNTTSIDYGNQLVAKSLSSSSSILRINNSVNPDTNILTVKDNNGRIRFTNFVNLTRMLNDHNELSTSANKFKTSDNSKSSKTKLVIDLTSRLENSSLNNFDNHRLGEPTESTYSMNNVFKEVNGHAILKDGHGSTSTIKSVAFPNRSSHHLPILPTSSSINNNAASRQVNLTIFPSSSFNGKPSILNVMPQVAKANASVILSRKPRNKAAPLRTLLDHGSTNTNKTTKELHVNHLTNTVYSFEPEQQYPYKVTSSSSSNSMKKSKSFVK